MAKPRTSTNTEKASFYGSLSLLQDEADTICGLIEDPNISPVQKIFAAAAEAMRSIAAGGKILSASIVDRIEQILGDDFDEEILPELIEQASHRRGGNLCGYWEIDPVYEKALSETADMRGVTLQELVQDMMDTAMDNEWLYQVDPRPTQVLMTSEDKAQVEELLGRKFSNGTELAEAIRSFCGSDSGIFSGV